MKHSRLLLLCLCLAMLFAVACQTPTPPDGPVTPPTELTPIEGVGSSLDESAPAMIAKPITGEETPVTADGLDLLIRDNALESGKLYRVSGSVALDLSGVAESDGKGAVIVADEGIKIIGFDGRLSNVTIQGALTLTDCKDATLERVQVTAPTALMLDAGCDDVALIECRFVGTVAGIENSSDTLTVLSSYSSGTLAIADNGAGNTYVENAYLCGGVTLGASDSSLRYCTVGGDVTTGACENLLVAMCDIKDHGVTFEGVHNSVVLLNETKNVAVKNSTTVFVCENNVYDLLSLDNTRYLLVNENALAKAPSTVAIRDYNGNNVTDVDARAENGVNEEILPHVNLDAHVNMERKTAVRTADRSNPDIKAYIEENLKTGSTVIVAPGAYVGDQAGVRITDVKDARLFAYGVLFEQDPIENFTQSKWGEYCAFWYTSCERISTHGLMVGTKENTVPQVIVLAKLPNNKILCAQAAGTNVAWTSSIEAGFRWDKSYCYGDVSSSDFTFDEYTGLWTFTYASQFAYDLIEVGDTITCRKGGNVFNLYYNTDLFFEDVSIVGGAVRCFYDNQAKSGTTLHRLIDVPAPAKVIDEETYHLYKGYEETYGVQTGVYIDEFGNYRGTPLRSATADFTHPHGSASGMKATSCIIDALTDDATNQQGKFNRLYDFDFETGALTYGYLRGALSNAGPRHYFAGDRLNLFTQTGKLICDTTVLRDSVKNEDGTYTLYIDPEALDPADIEGFDLDNTCVSALQILVDNRSRNCNGMVYDNILVTNIRSRGFLIKNSDVVVKNCSFINIGMGAIAINMELEWSESGVSENVVIKDNYFENTGYYTNLVYYSPITVYSFAVQSDPSYLAYRDMLIEGNVVRNRATPHALFLCGVQNVTVKDNDFGDHCEYENHPAAYVIFSQDVEFTGNTYTSVYDNRASAQVVGTDYKNLFGSDFDAPMTGDKYGTANRVSAFMENTPTDSGEGHLNFFGGWDVGYMPVDEFKFFPYTGMEGAGHWITVPGTLWAGIGGMGTTAREFRFLATATNNAAYRYTMDKDATVAIALSRFFPPYPKARGDGSDNGLFAIFVNGEMIWPSAGGNYRSDGDWYYINQHTSQSEINRSLSELSLSLSEGDVISFIAKRPYGAERSMFGAVPAVYYID